MVSLKNKKGFTIVELLIVIVVIGILATLVIVTFTGIQQKGRNTQRQTDIKAVQGYVESFYAEYGYYPYGEDMTNPAFLAKYMKGLDPKALVDPKQKQDGSETYTTAAPAAEKYVYSYQPTTSTNTYTLCTGATPTETDPTDTGCVGYKLTAVLEGKPFDNGGKYTKESN